MATTRGGATNGRERVGQSSSSPPTSAKANPKPVPSYLRPTKSSKSLDSPTNPKKPNTESSTPKQPITAARRRSLDRPPSMSQIQNTIPGAREAKPTRSSSFSASTRMAPVIKRVEQPQLSKSRSLSPKVPLSSKVGYNKDSSSSSRVSRLKKKSGPKSVTSESSNDFSDNHSIEHLVSDDDIAYTQHNIQSLPEISEMPDSNEELKDPTNQDLEAKHVVEEKTEDDQQDEKPTADVKVVTDEPEPEPQPQPQPQPQEIETPEKEEIETPEKEETITEDVRKNEEQNDQIVEEKQEESTLKENEEEEKKDEELVVEEEDKGEEKTEVEEDKGQEKTEVEEEDKKEIVRTPSPPPPSTSPVKTRQPSPKKENQDYNEVIEKTASKMMGRKNRVLALAGAFETVISLQDK